MAAYKPKPLSKEQRIEIYREALRTFRKMAETKAHAKNVTGMCEHIYNAIRRLKYNRSNVAGHYMYKVDMTSRNFPEYYSYRPSTNWKDSNGWGRSGFWWSTKTPKGREKRLAIMEAIAEGKSKGE